MEIYPKGSRARILLSSVFGPFAQNDEFGSRSMNPMELYHNQVTRAQGGGEAVASGRKRSQDLGRHVSCNPLPPRFPVLWVA